MVEDKYKKDFENWCKRERIRLVPNNEVFFINKRKTLVPMYKSGTNVFFHIDDLIEDKDHPMYQAFADSFYTIIVIPKTSIADLIKYVTKQDIAQRFEVNI